MAMPVDLFADLDAGKAVILHFFMPSCGSCPPPAQKIQTMANNINAMHPAMVKGLCFPFQNSTTCAYAASWVSSNNLGTLYNCNGQRCSTCSKLWWFWNANSSCI
jgi:hypothetical protein